MRILEKGAVGPDRTGTGTIRVSGERVVFDLSEAFPLLTSKYTWFRGVKEELFFFISGQRNLRALVKVGVNIWNEWPFKRYLKANNLEESCPVHSPAWEQEIEKFVKEIKTGKKFAQEWGDLGPIYGYQWRHWRTPEGGEIDQLQEAIDALKENPYSRRIIVSAWSPADIKELTEKSLPPCHILYQFVAMPDRKTGEEKIDCMMYMRSCDVFLGLPFNIASYALLTELVARLTGYQVAELKIFIGDAHIYLNHLDQVQEQLKNPSFTSPRLVINTGKDPVQKIEDFKPEHLQIENYQYASKIKAPISV
jgi:thymidylate synthase